MSSPSTIDRESFQTLLASAFAVQQSQMDRQSLSAIVEGARRGKSGSVHEDEAAPPVGDGSRNLSNITTSVARPFPELDEDDRNSGVFLSHLASTLSAHSGGAAAADVALDDALNDIAEQARLAVNGVAAAIALMRGEEMFCRTATGKSALELGGLLDGGAGRSGDWTQARKEQCCADTETDAGVDVVACRRLGVRSFLILPLLKQEELVGLFGVFSPNPEAFGDREHKTLEVLSRQVLVQIDCATEFSTLPPKDEPPAAADSKGATPATFRIGPMEVKTAQFQLRDPRTLLLVAVIFLALMLGWMLGRSTRRETTRKEGPSAMVGGAKAIIPPPTGETKEAEPSPPLPVHPKARSPEAPSGGLVVYQDGKVIYRLNPSQTQGDSSDPDSALASSKKENVQLLQRVEPEYPAAAKQQHIQGPVVLEAKIGEEGEVQQITLISGDSMLATAASDAVLQWRFKPRLQNGRAIPFQARITVKFVLP